MHIHPSQTGSSELITKKHFWLAAYVAALHRKSAAEAIAEADEALRLCDERWRDAEYVGHWKFKHDFPVGWDFPSLEK